MILQGKHPSNICILCDFSFPVNHAEHLITKPLLLHIEKKRFVRLTAVACIKKRNCQLFEILERSHKME